MITRLMHLKEIDEETYENLLNLADRNNGYHWIKYCTVDSSSVSMFDGGFNEEPNLISPVTVLWGELLGQVIREFKKRRRKQ